MAAGKLKVYTGGPFPENVPDSVQALDAFLEMIHHITEFLAVLWYRRLHRLAT